MSEPLHHQFDRQGGLYSISELQQWQHLQEVPHYQRLLTTELAQGVCTGIDNCALTPVPGAPSYTLANLEATALEAVTPQWIENLKAVGYWGGFILAWFSPVGFALILWKQPNRNQMRNTEMFPLSIHNSSITAPAPTPTTIATDLQSNQVEELPLKTRHAGALLGPEGVHHRDGGCKDGLTASYF